MTTLTGGSEESRDDEHPVPADHGAGWQPVVESIGPKIREQRKALGLSLQHLARRADVSAAAIHKVERRDMVPTVTTLLKLAAALDCPIGHFVEQHPVDGPVAVHTLATNRPPLPASTEQIDLGGITGPPERFRTTGAVATVRAGTEGGNGAGLRPGEELVVMLAGTLDFEVAGQRHTLQPGDSLHYPTDRPYCWTNPGPEPARAVWIALSGG